MSGKITVVNEEVRAVLALQRENLILRGDIAALEAQNTALKDVLRPILNDPWVFNASVERYCVACLGIPHAPTCPVLRREELLRTDAERAEKIAAHRTEIQRIYDELTRNAQVWLKHPGRRPSLNVRRESLHQRWDDLEAQIDALKEAKTDVK